MTGEMIRRLRRARKMTQQILSDQVGISRVSLANWETGNTIPKTENLMKLARFFEVPITELIGEGD
jgi:transcriptional regulator with XRE-family HTH domain